MHPLTYKVMQGAWQLEFDQFKHLEDRERLNTIRTLAVEQVRDDDPSSDAERHGKTRQRVFRPGDMEDPEEHEIWPQRTRRQLALEAGMEPVLSMVITAEERVLLRQVYDEKPDGGLRTIGARYGVSHVAILKRLRRINKKLREEMLKVYGPREEVVEGGELPEEEGP